MYKIAIGMVVSLLVSGCFSTLSMSTMEIAQRNRAQEDAKIAAWNAEVKKEYDRKELERQARIDELLANTPSEFRILVTNDNIKNNRKPTAEESNVLSQIYDIKREMFYNYMTYLSSVTPKDEREFIEIQRKTYEAFLYYFRQLQSGEIGFLDYHNRMRELKDENVNQMNSLNARINQQRENEYAAYRETLRNISAENEAAYQQRRNQQTQYPSTQYINPWAPGGALYKPPPATMNCTQTISGFQCTTTQY